MSSSSGYSVVSARSVPARSLPNNEEDVVKMLCQKSEQAIKRIEKSRSHRERFLADLMLLPEEQNRRLELLKISVRRFEEVLYSGRLTGAKNREHHLTTMQKVYAFLEADPKQKEKLDKMEVEVDKLLDQAMEAHKEYYKFEKRFDAEDMLFRVQEMSYQVNIVEETFSKSQVCPPLPLLVYPLFSLLHSPLSTRF